MSKVQNDFIPLQEYISVVTRYFIRTTRSNSELARLHRVMHFSVITQVRRGLRKLTIMSGCGLGVSRHFSVVSAESVVQATSATNCVRHSANIIKPVLGLPL